MGQGPDLKLSVFDVAYITTFETGQVLYQSMSAGHTRLTFCKQGLAGLNEHANLHKLVCRGTLSQQPALLLKTDLQTHRSNMLPGSTCSYREPR